MQANRVSRDDRQEVVWPSEVLPGQRQQLRQAQAVRLTVDQKKQEQVNDLFGRLFAEIEFLLKLNGVQIKPQFEKYLLDISNSKVNHGLNIQTYLLGLSAFLMKTDPKTKRPVYETPKFPREYVDRLEAVKGRMQDPASKALLDHVVACMRSDRYEPVSEAVADLIMAADQRDALCKDLVTRDQKSVLAMNEFMHRVNDHVGATLEEKVIRDGTAGKGVIRDEPLVTMDQLNGLKQSKRPNMEQTWSQFGEGSRFDPC